MHAEKLKTVFVQYTIDEIALKKWDEYNLRQLKVETTSAVCTRVICHASHAVIVYNLH